MLQAERKNGSPTPMPRRSAVAATALLAVLLAPPLGRAAPMVAAPANPPAVARDATQPEPVKATPEERAAAGRMAPLAQAAFWGREAQIDPTDAEAGVKLSVALRALGQYDAAVQSASRVLVLDPKNFDAMMEIARAEVAAGQGFYAIDPLQRAQALAPKDWRPLSVLGIAYAEVRRGQDAQTAWRAALALSPDNPSVLSNMAMEMAADGDAAGAEPLLRRAAAQPTASLTVRQDLTLVLGLEGKLGEAETLLRQDLPPDQADADLAYLQAVYAGRGSTESTAAAARTWESMKSGGS
jgi:Flp pilus assembly protein TadD